MRPTNAKTGDLQSNFTDSDLRDELLCRLLDHCECIPDAKEVFELLDVLRGLEAITADESASIMSMYWKGV